MDAFRSKVWRKAAANPRCHVLNGTKSQTTARAVSFARTYKFHEDEGTWARMEIGCIRQCTKRALGDTAADGVACDGQLSSANTICPAWRHRMAS